MKKLCAAIGCAGVLLATNLYAAYDGTITLNGGSFQFGQGGEFSATTTFTPGSPNLGSFSTFCIEDNEFVGLGGSTYNYKINTGAVNGGVSGGNPDNISIGTAWLYSQFRAGTLANYFTGDRHQHAGDLQNAIWFLEGEFNTLVHDGADGTAYYDLARSVLGGATPLTGAQVKADSNGAYGVVALNLYSGPDFTGPSQDMLAIVPEPTTMIAGALLLLPFGASTVRILRRKTAV